MTTTYYEVLSDGTERPITLKLLAGRGNPGDMAWGMNFDGYSGDKAQNWLENLQPYIGKKLYLTGGGGRGISLVTLKKAWITEYGKGKTVQVRLSPSPFPTREIGEDGKLHTKNEDFTPFMDSWKLSVRED